jgi:ubiquinone/menaquinone biosynthesis C-methylase UbiE
VKIYELKDSCRANFNHYTRKAYESIPNIEKPNILDLGCGTGVQTLEIASITNGNILAVDTDKDCLEWFESKIKKLKLGKRIKIINNSVLNVAFQENSYDIIIAEGLFNVIGFGKALTRFSKLLKVNGYFMIHDDALNRDKKTKLFEDHQFELVKSFMLDESVWWDQYYDCMEKAIVDFGKRDDIDKKSYKLLKEVQSEIDWYKEDPSEFRSIYYILRKTHRD